MTRQSFSGTAASIGAALGALYRLDRPTELSESIESTLSPEGLVDAALDATALQLLTLSQSLRVKGDDDQSSIMEVNSFIARDPDLRATAHNYAHQGLSATEAIARAVHEYAESIARLADETLADRAADVRMVGRRATGWLNGESRSNLPDGPVVVMAQEIAAADLLELGSAVVGAGSVIGGPNSHAAIVARSMGIPLLLGMDPAALDLPDGLETYLATEQGEIVTEPTASERLCARTEMSEAFERKRMYASARGLPSTTVDGRVVALRANIATAFDSVAAKEVGADGVGLLRTELPFLEAASWPTEFEHAAVLTPILRPLACLPVTVRTLDFADDKLPPFLSGGHRVRRIGRGLPLMLAEPDAFSAQFRAILTAGRDTDLRIMIPMVSTIDEFDQCRALLHEAAQDTGQSVPPLGAMIELREAVDLADQIAAQADFLSIGTNDLTGQILGLDRRDPAAVPALAAHPSVLRAIDTVVRAAHHHQRQVSICGDAAAHPLVGPLLVGLGCDIFSASPSSIDELRVRVRTLAFDDCARLVSDALSADTAEEVWQLVRERCPTAADR